ncbi:MAG: ABC transporter permease [Pseudomonadales bacterium]
MFSNYLISSLRSLKRQKLFTAINVSGLAIGLAACTLIILFVQHEFSYDMQYRDIDRLYRIEASAHIPGQDTNESPAFFGATYDLLPGDFEEIESVARLQLRGGTIIKGDSSTLETFATVDPEFLTMFDFPVIEGALEGALDDPLSIVLTEEMAIKHLGQSPWTGRTLIVNETIEREMKVAAVIETLPGNTHLDIDMLVPVSQLVFDAASIDGRSDLTRWNGLLFNVYIKLKEGRSITGLNNGINDWVDRYFPPEIQALVGIKGSELFTPRIMPVRDIHMLSPVRFDMKSPGSLSTIYSFSGIAFLMLLIACINFMNLATAASTLRAKEVALRKVMGANRRQLFVQFEIESVLLSLIALFFALVIIELILPSFSNYTERQLSSSMLADPVIMLSIISLTLTIGILSGFHPAYLMSRLYPAQVLQSNKSGVAGNTNLRALLVLFQFTISAVLIIMTALIYIQTDYARTLNMGYDNDNVLSVAGLFRLEEGNSAEAIRDEVSRIPGISQATLASFTPGDGRNTGLSLKVPGIDDRVIIFYRSIYPEFFAQFAVEAIAGRLLDNAHPNDRTIFIRDPQSRVPQAINVVINETAVRKLGFSSPLNAVGQVYYRGAENQIVNTIVGVVPDIHFGSPRSELDAEIYMFIPEEIRTLLVTYQGKKFEDINREIEDLLLRMLPKTQSRITHLQENIARQYREEEIQSTLLAMFSGLAVLIACMGLFGLASFTITRRTKEIGIRKVMGATSREIVMLLLTQFSKPVLIANILAWPLCWYAFNQWLDGFINRIDLVPWFIAVVALAATLTLLLAWGTIASHVIRVARSNPVFALRYE